MIYNNIFHSAKEILTQLDSWSQSSCKGILHKKTAVEGGNRMDYYLIDSDKHPNANKQSVYMLFGEHSRELISPELGYFMIKAICSNVKEYTKSTINKILEQNKFLIVPIVNLPGRMDVENGDYCKRTNENGVDLNRNWDVHFKLQSNDPDQVSGNHPFSEWQTQVLKQLLTEFNPKIFISIHSGALGMYSPPAYKIINMKKADFKEKKLIKILKILNEKYCNCQAGPAANELWYVCPGNCMDYAYEKDNVDYSFAFEIFTNQKSNEKFLEIINRDKPIFFNYDKFLKEYADKNLHALFIEKMSRKLRSSFTNLVQLDQQYSYTPHDHIHDETTEFSCFAETKEGWSRNNEFCLKQFGPLTIKHRRNTVINWTNVIFELVSIIYQIDPK